MPVDFFAVPCANPAGNCTVNAIFCLAVIPNPHFGISDIEGGNNKPAAVVTENPAQWDFTVNNNSGVVVRFKAVDWCVPIYRTGTYNLADNARTSVQFSSNNFGAQLIKRCEGFLQFDDKILFLEIKRRKKKPSEWIEDAREKFEETLLSFKEHHPLLAHQIIKPLLANPIHTGVSPNEMIQKRILKDKVGVEFIRQNSITI
jgi:hypothetical protein